MSHSASENQSLIKDQCDTFNRLSLNYQGFKQEINTGLLDDLSSMANTFKQDALQSLDENRVLRIGIIGQIKRGKSSFLNSLLFNGQDILPKAATPMTAALTKISYSEQPSASVEFYTRSEWEKVKSTAAMVEQAQRDYERDHEAFLQAQRNNDYTATRPAIVQPSDEQKACLELIGMMNANGVNVEEYLDKIETITQVSSNEDLVSELNAYVGAHGKFTPIVKSTELKLNIDGLKDIEVVDTPGMNDPIVSRGRRTQEFIGQCDVIFFLSYCSQFLDMHDMSLLAQNIPSKGIEEIVLVGSIFDSALLDTCHDYDSIQQALPGLTTKLADQAKDNVDDVCRKEAHAAGGSSTNAIGQGQLMKTLKNALPPTFISSRCLDLADKLSADSPTDSSALNEEEQHSLDQLNDMFDDFEFTSDSLKAVANFRNIDKKLALVRSKKEAIIADRFGNLLRGAKNGMAKKLLQIKDDVSYKYKLLSEGDLNELAAKQQAIIKNIKAGEVKVQAVFESYRIKAEKALIKVGSDIELDSLNAKQVQSQAGSREESYEVSRSVSSSSWYDPFSWGSTRTVTDTKYRTVNYTYANVQAAVDQLEEFVVNTSRQLFQASEQAINLESFRKEIKNSVRDMFDFADDDFDPEMVLLPLNTSVERITIPSIKLDLTKHIDTIRNQFSDNEVEGNEMAKLRVEQGRVVALLLSDIAAELKDSIKAMVNKLSKEEVGFIPSLSKDLNASVEQLSRDLKDKEANLKRYRQVLSQLDQDQPILAQGVASATYKQAELA